ncbi:MAG: hypothetical protein OMM_05135 [Candidatus Magnetoglobus multicellularis str. Araruama]|uniref:Uncharacterized protein n=1 Tax=Candidatus Magnetoglobus multicellularis str. Araruama TaxID=890399 RepID=A0A1V1NY62_9BACT|nr:MAG: hypothetical protein OMM_05135 [Candidatus Magnetoglobus multicellularis str. Araruama]
MKTSVMSGITVLSLLFGLFQVAFAADEATTEIAVSVSLTPEIKISVSESEWTIGAIGLNETITKNGIVVEVGNIETKVDISATDGESEWKLGNTPGENQFAVKVDGEALPLSKIMQPYDKPNVKLDYQSPTSDTIGANKSQDFKILFKASLYTEG